MKRSLLISLFFLYLSSVSAAGLLWPDGIEPGDPSICEAPSGARCWWVDVSAPEGGNGNYGAPYNSFEQVESLIQGSDIVYVRGTFAMTNNNDVTNKMTLNLNSPARGGTAQYPTTIKSWRGSSRAIFDGNAVTDGILRVSSNSGVRFQNIEIRNFGDRGIIIGDAVTYAEFVSIVAHDGAVTPSSGIGGAVVLYAQDSVHTFIVRNSLFYETTLRSPGYSSNTGALSLISEMSALDGSTFTVYNNVFHDNYIGVRHKHAGNIHMNAYNNTFYNNDQSFHLRTLSADIYNNTIYNDRIAAFLYTDNMNANHEYTFRYNTVYNTDWLVNAFPDQGGYVANIHIERNIVIDPSGGQGTIHLGSEDWNWGANDISGWTMNDNIFYFTPSTRDVIYSPAPTKPSTKFHEYENYSWRHNINFCEPYFHQQCNKRLHASC